MNKREILRGNRYIGEGKSHLDDGIHTWNAYDLELDTYNTTSEENITKIIQLLAKTNNITEFKKFSTKHWT